MTSIIYNSSPAQWDALITSLPGPHLLQTAEWAQSKTQVGWHPTRLVWCENSPGAIDLFVDQWPGDRLIRAAVQVLERSLYLRGFSARLRILYAPKGPLLDWKDKHLRQRVIADMQTYARKRRAIFLKIDPDIPMSTGLNLSNPKLDLSGGQEIQDLLTSNGWQYSQDQIQFRNTVLIDLTSSEADLLARMKQKTRYNIRLASRKGVTIRRGTSQDFPMLYRMYAETSLRDGFTIRDESYYLKVWNAFPLLEHSPISKPVCQPLIAEVDGEPVAALVLFLLAQKAWYLYGMSQDTHRDKMPNYLLQWEAICLSKSAGCQIYDLWGAPEMMAPNDPLWGVYRFKEGLGGSLTRFLGAWDYPVRPWLYKLYTQTMPRLLALMRRSGQARTRHFAG